MEAAAIAELFSAFGPVRCRRMFGGIGVYANGVMFALEARDDLYLKADEITRASFEREGCAPFAYDAKGWPRIVTSYWRLPERLLDDPEELAAWARDALAAARRQQGRRRPERRAAASIPAKKGIA